MANPLSQLNGGCNLRKIERRPCHDSGRRRRFEFGEARSPLLEERPPARIDRGRVATIFVIQLDDVAEVESGQALQRLSHILHRTNPPCA